MHVDRDIPAIRPYRVVILTLDSHAAGPCARAAERLARDYPGLDLSVHAAAEWGACPEALGAARDAIAGADIVLANLLFLEEHINAILPDLAARRAHCDAMIGIIADAQIVRLTRMGTLDMARPDSALGRLMKKLRGAGKSGTDDGARKMKMLRRLPRILRLIPGKAQDLRAWFLIMQYWLGASDDNIEAMVRFLIGRYCRHEAWRGTRAPAPLDYPDTGLYHPDLATRITEDAADLPQPEGATGTVGLLMMRSYVLSGDTAHYDAVIRALQARGLRVLPAFAGGLDGRPAIAAFFRNESGAKIDALLSLTGFSLVGGPAYNDNAAALEVLTALDIPYVAAHPLEFQTLGQWAAAPQGLGPIETTMLIALPELDGATNPTVFGGRHGPEGCAGCAQSCQIESHAPGAEKRMAPCPERVGRLADRVARQVALRRGRVAERRVGIVLFGFPPNAGAAGTAAYLDVFRSLFNTLHAMTSSRPRRSRICAVSCSKALRANTGRRPMSRPMSAPRIWSRTCPGSMRSRRNGARRRAACNRTGAASISWARASARSLSDCNRPSAMKATRCAFSSSAALPRPMPLRNSISGYARPSARTCSCISGCMARSNSCPENRPGQGRPAGPTGSLATCPMSISMPPTTPPRPAWPSAARVP
jgi:magnesium chelatase subunit H